ncbi:YhgE/Pip domain-containing protein [Microbacterium esteraromaticum]|uniref:YhgE/Pip family protein n=1 Tax=Microbacterium esteraromaticum TaxID=57043 RepID=UPI001A8F5491|nr:YhgE/Pip domain-containing protein [Microbacterium esteraromaticum]MBN8424823.1 YhgE/Pip domain-containing protein [Microbacterium esteraromaticum]
MKVPSMIAAELRRLVASPMAVVALIALLAVPVLYGGLYLWANQDPYGKFTEVPVALVVDDTGTGDAENPQNYGSDVAEQLLSDGSFDWRVMTASEAGAALSHGTVDFTVTIPRDFSDALASASGDHPRQARIELETNDANNYLASSIGTQAVERIRRSVAEMVGSEAAGQLLSGLSDVRANLADAVDGTGQLLDGAHSAKDGSSSLATGLGTLADGTDALALGARSLADGAAQVSAGNRKLAEAADDAAVHAQQAADALPGVRADLAAGMAEHGLTAEQIDAVLTDLDPLAARLQDGNTAAQRAVDQVDELAAGAQRLSEGAARLSTGTRDAADGAASARDGAARLDDGLGALGDGIGSLRDGLASGVAAIPASTAELRAAQADTIADPVHVSSDKVAAARDYGQGLAPFFAALAGWIGIYALFLIVKPISRRAVTALHSPLRITLAGWLTPAMLGALQMVGLIGVLGYMLGFDFSHPWGSLGVMVMASATYAAIILALNVWLGSVGQFMGLVLMVLQLVTAGGTFPWQTLPEPLAGLHHVLPMGYVVDALRQLMYGGDLTRALYDLAILAAWLIGALALAAVGVTRMTHRRTLRDLQPSLIG